MKLRSKIFTTIIGASLLALPGVSMADGVVLGPDALGASRAHIEELLHASRARDPKLWKAVERIDRYRPDGARKSRSQNPLSVGVTYRRLGPSARFALLDLAVFHAPKRDGLDDNAWKALQIGLVDAIGVAADPDLAPFLRASFEKSEAIEVQGVAAVGLGRLGAAELPLLIAHAQAGDPRLLPSVRGLGASHKLQAVAALGKLLDSATDERLVTTIADALAESGSAWVWGAGKLGTRADEDAVRRAAAGAIVRNYPRFEAGPAGELEVAIRRVAHPETAAMIGNVRATSSATSAARLDHLTAIVNAR